MRPLKVSRSMLVRVGDGSQGKFVMSQEHNIGRRKSYFMQKEGLALGSSFLVITQPFIYLFIH